MDRAQIALLRRGNTFQDGWGDLSHAHAVATDLLEPGPIASISPVLSAPSRILGADLRIGEFVSPDTRLPEEARTVRFWWLHPADQDVRGVVVMPASWGDEGPTVRGRQVGQLVRKGLSIVFMENPFYGCRRRTGQVAGGLRTVADFIHMQGAAFIEHRHLMAWVREQVDAPMVLAGFSMGGHLAAALATVSPGVPLVSMAPPLAPSEPFAHGNLGVCVKWDALGPCQPTSRRRWMELMYAFDLRLLPALPNPAGSRVLGLRHDGLVPRHHAKLLADTWDVPFRWVDVGHIGSVIIKSNPFRAAVLEVLGIPRSTRRWMPRGLPALTDGGAS